MNKEQEEFNEINNIVSKTINILSDDDFCKLWEYILKKRHEIIRLNKVIEEKTYLYNKLDTESKYAITDLQDTLKDREEYCYGLETHLDNLKKIIDITKNNIDITIQIIKEQPTGNDEWILERLNGIREVMNK